MLNVGDLKLESGKTYLNAVGGVVALTLTVCVQVGFNGLC